MDILEKINFYEFNESVGVVEVFVDFEFKEIKEMLGNFTIEDKSLPKDSWQVPYMEQYFHADKMTKLCDTHDEPANDTKGFYLVFFIYNLAKGQVLYTPFGNIIVTELKLLPAEYKTALEFDNFD